MSGTGVKEHEAHAAHGEHPANLGHHFDTPEQQFESGKLGMWLFLATEVLLFGGLFVGYATYRSNHPEIFVYAHQFLNRNLGALNTVILINSSLTMAFAVRAAQLGQRRALIGFLVATLVFAGGFLVVKKVEYEEKWKHGLLWGKRFQPAVHEEESHAGAPGETTGHLPTTSVVGHAGGGPAARVDGIPGGLSGNPAEPTHDSPVEVPTIPHDAGAASGGASPVGSGGATSGVSERTALPQAARPPPGLAANANEEGHGGHRPSNVHLFFGIYFVMTGLHGIHVIAGMIAITWILIRSIRGEFSSEYFTPVDLTGLYWHLVDLIWIFLFPLFYLIT